MILKLILWNPLLFILISIIIIFIVGRFLEKTILKRKTKRQKYKIYKDGFDIYHVEKQGFFREDIFQSTSFKECIEYIKRRDARKIYLPF